MGIVTYLGINFPIEKFIFPLENQMRLEEGLNVDSLKENKEVMSKYLYEIVLNGQLNDLNPQAKIESPIDYENARNALYTVYKSLQSNIKEDDFAEILVCWLGEENEELLGSEQLSLKLQEIPEILMEERFLITFIND